MAKAEKKKCPKHEIAGAHSEAKKLHACPYLEDAKDDDNTLCECCIECMKRCIEEI